MVGAAQFDDATGVDRHAAALAAYGRGVWLRRVGALLVGLDDGQEVLGRGLSAAVDRHRRLQHLPESSA